MPIPGGTLSLEDDAGRLIEEANVEGELIYRGPNVMAGYAFQREDLADAAPGERLATGDLAVRRSDGLYVITGRRTRFIKPLGRRIGLDEVEQLLARRGITAAAVPQGEGMLVAHEGDAPIDTVELAEELGMPVSYISIRSMLILPRLASGKIDYVSVQDARSTYIRRWLPTNMVSFARDTTLEAWNILAGTNETRDVFTIFSETLRRPVQPEDSFVKLGADSLNYVELSIALEDAAGTLPDGWIHLSLRDLERWRVGLA